MLSLFPNLVEDDQLTFNAVCSITEILNNK